MFLKLLLALSLLVISKCTPNNQTGNSNNDMISAFDPIELTTTYYTNSITLKNVEFGYRGASSVDITFKNTSELGKTGKITIDIIDHNQTEITIFEIYLNNTDGTEKNILQAATKSYEGLYDLRVTVSSPMTIMNLAKIQFYEAGPTPGQWYMIMSRLNGKVVEVAGTSTFSGRIDMWTFFYGSNQQFKFDYVSDGLYTIVVKHSGLVLEVKFAGFGDNEYVQSADYKGTENQLWIVKPAEDGLVMIVNKNSYKCLDIYGGQTNNGAFVNQFGCAGAQNQKFYLIPVC